MISWRLTIETYEDRFSIKKEVLGLVVEEYIDGEFRTMETR